MGKAGKGQEASQLTLLQKERVKRHHGCGCVGGKDGHSLSQLKSPDEIPDIDSCTQGGRERKRN